ncbi:MAG TPA: amino acid adenylation domain-containing protein, partial [Thermoanaerobaculia bacterium]|nr:amino acid adenylation domain-containing protein [Thermoanaerobaculia bacterium]
HQDVPFEKLVEDLEPERSLTFTPFFQVLFTLDRPPLPADLSDLAPATMTPQIGSAKFDLTFTLMELPDGLVGSVEHTTDLFDTTTALRLAGQLETLLAGFVAHPGRAAGELPLLAEAERHQVLIEANEVAGSPPASTLHGLFFRQAERTPDRPALHWQEGTLTYGELRRRVDGLAIHLRRLGVGPEVPAAVFLDRRPELVAGLLAILAAGGAYVPLDPVYPRERLSLTLEDCQAPVVLTRSGLVDRLPPGPETVLLDVPQGVGDGTGPREAATAGNLAYLIYTSGSTGRPKGVAIEHRSAVALLDWAGELFPDADLAGVLASTSICFDLSVFEIFLPLARGGTIVLADSALDLLAMGDETPVTLINTVPSAAAELTRGRSLPAGVRTLNMAGEPIPPALVARLAAEPRLGRVFNLYGPSEATTYSTWERVAVESDGTPRSPAIGRPIAGTSAYVVDRGQRPVPSGVPGELWLGGAGLARGYLGRPELTAAGFVPDPFGGEPGARLYRTGDLVRRLPDGRLDFLGRIDHQVKVRGFRIELGEIETVLARHPQVAGVTVAVREAKGGAPGERRLVAYVVPRDGAGDLGIQELRGFVRQALPEFMVPSDFVALRTLPLTPSGKVDRKALPEPGALRLGPETVYAEPKSALEQTVATVLREVLGIERVGLNDNFFDLGGHSLRLVRVAAVLEERLGRPVQVLDLFRSPTVALLCAAWATSEAPAAPPVPEASAEELEQRADDRRQGRARRRELRLDRASQDLP